MVKIGEYQIEGFSIGGWTTCISIPSRKLCFDIGECPLYAINIPSVFFTHGHTDHTGGIVRHCATRELKGWSPPEYFIHDSKINDLQDLFRVWRRINGSELKCKIMGLFPGDIIPLDDFHEVECFEVRHAPESLGYALISKKTILAPEFKGKTPSALIDLKQKGININKIVRNVDLVFSGDASIEILDEPLVKSANLLILECTFVDDKVTPESAQKYGHIHLDQIIEHQDKIQNPNILFTHFSSRYKTEEIVKSFEKLPDGLKNRSHLLI
jgi:ribonuclease Z